MGDAVRNQFQREPQPPGNEPGIDPHLDQGAEARREAVKLRERLCRLRQLSGEFLEYAAYYLSARADGLRATGARFGLYAAAGLLGLVAVCTTVATAIVLLMCGLGLGVGSLLGERSWLGLLVTGLVALVALVAGAYWGSGRLLRSWRSKTVGKYEQRKQRQAKQFGRNVQDAASRHERAGIPGKAG